MFTPVATSGAVVGSGAPPMDPRFVMGPAFMQKNPWILIYATWHSRHGSAQGRNAEKARLIMTARSTLLYATLAQYAACTLE